MASILRRNSSYSVIYRYMVGDIRKQKWDRCLTKKDAQARKSFVEYYQK